MFFPVVMISKMMTCGGRKERQKLLLWRERESCRCGERETVGDVPGMPAIDFSCYVAVVVFSCVMVFQLRQWCFEGQKQCRVACINNLPRT